MTQINNGFMPYYFLCNDGDRIYNEKTGGYISPSSKGEYKLLNIEGKRKGISKRKLIKMVFGYTSCIDDIKDLQGEIWEYIPNTNNCYMVSNMGRVKSLKRKRAILLQQINNGCGYKKVSISWDDGKNRNIYVHQLVASVFCRRENDSIFYICHHINKIKDDNRACNLMLVTPKEHAKIHQKDKIKEIIEDAK